MTVKVLVTAIGQHIVADVKQVEQKETKEVIAYWLTNPRIATYSVGENQEVNVRFGTYCLISDEAEFSVRADHVVSILEPRDEVVEKYQEIITVTEPEEEAPDETVSGVDTLTAGDGTDSAD